MTIKKVYNNNVILAFENSSKKEVILTGCGIGFGKKPNDTIDDSKIEKKFVIQDNNFESKVNKLASEIPEEVFAVSSAIIEYAEKNLNTTLDEYIYISLTDHIYFALKRYKENLPIKNELLYELRRIHKKEYEIGKWAIEYINKTFNVNFLIDEAGFIAMHIINANYRESTNKSCLIMNIINQILDIIKNYYSIEFIEDEINFDRLLTHLKFFAKRLIDKTESIDTNNNGLLEIVKVQYKESYDCVKQIKSFIEENYTYKVNDDEVLYLILHINRVISVINFNKEITKSYV
ncbi:MAG: PRD domain-containing protein [Peptostreptococcaceae bacterium]|uniref:BglG family transcription antiterminator LicT n=1 Tax=Romboutsia timonensis TaxID=1776391 RepID=UPI001DD7B2C2|nr:PRD domain-containing protein [Peptostreptococcaceae bacterium]MCA9748356.1 PRD domain-containing protein [Romboutsia sp.]